MPTTTPLLWQENVNPVQATAGDQSFSRTIGLSNGNILVVWVDNNNSNGPGAGDDIVGQLYDPLGGKIGDNFQINAFRTNRSEDVPSIAATDDGGFVVAYAYASGADTDIVFERHSADGGFVSGRYVVNDNSSATTNYDPQIAFRPDGTSVVVYATVTGDTHSIVAREILANGDLGGFLTLRTDGGGNDDPRNVAVATLNNGSVGVVYQERDGDDFDLETHIISATGLSTVSSDENFVVNNVEDRANDIAALAGGGFVVVWEQRIDGSGDIWAATFTNNGTRVLSPVALSINPDNQNEVQVIGLKDGTFFVIWDNDTDDRIEGRRYDTDGDPVGGRVILSDVGGFLPDIALTPGGRILVTYTDDSAEEVYLTILDPRDEAFTVTDGSVTVAARDGSIIDGSDARDTFYGVEGNDDFSGKKGNDSLFGGQDNDEIAGGKGRDLIKGGKGNDDLSGDLGDDEIYGDRGRDLIEGGDQNDDIFGGDGNDTAYGQSGKDTLEGGKNNDDLYGGGGDDELKGGKGQDVIIGGKGQDKISGDRGADVFVFTAVNESKSGGANRDTITDFTHTIDRIDLSLIDADTTRSGNQAFEFIGAAGFSDEGQLRAKVVSGNIILQADRDGDGQADFEVRLLGPVTVDQDDFIL